MGISLRRFCILVIIKLEKRVYSISELQDPQAFQKIRIHQCYRRCRRLITDCPFHRLEIHNISHALVWYFGSRWCLVEGLMERGP